MVKKKGKLSNMNIEKILDNSFQQLEDIENLNFETAKILSKYSLFDLAKKILIENLKSDYDDVDFICAISKYLFLSNMNLIKENALDTHKTIISETKTFFKYIKKSLRRVEKQFDETYLLIKGKDEIFYALENAKLLDSLEELSQILNLTNYHREAELAFDLKSKIELGFQRYFIYEKEEIVLSGFSSSGDYQIANDLELVEILEYFDLNIKPKLNFKTNNFYDVLLQMNYLKKTNKIEFDKMLKKHIDLFEFFPRNFYTKDEYKVLNRISVSINNKFEDNAMHLIKKKLVLIHTFHVDSYNLVLKILK